MGGGWDWKLLWLKKQESQAGWLPASGLVGPLGVGGWGAVGPEKIPISTRLLDAFKVKPILSKEPPENPRPSAALKFRRRKKGGAGVRQLGSEQAPKISRRRNLRVSLGRLGPPGAEWGRPEAYI